MATSALGTLGATATASSPRPVVADGALDAFTAAPAASLGSPSGSPRGTSLAGPATTDSATALTEAMDSLSAPVAAAARTKQVATDLAASTIAPDAYQFLTNFINGDLDEEVYTRVGANKKDFANAPLDIRREILIYFLMDLSQNALLRLELQGKAKCFSSSWVRGDAGSSSAQRIVLSAIESVQDRGYSSTRTPLGAIVGMVDARTSDMNFMLTAPFRPMSRLGDRFAQDLRASFSGIVGISQPQAAPAASSSSLAAMAAAAAASTSAEQKTTAQIVAQKFAQGAKALGSFVAGVGTPYTTLPAAVSAQARVTATIAERAGRIASTAILTIPFLDQIPVVNLFWQGGVAPLARIVTTIAVGAVIGALFAGMDIANLVLGPLARLAVAVTAIAFVIIGFLIIAGLMGAAAGVVVTGAVAAPFVALATIAVAGVVDLIKLPFARVAKAIANAIVNYADVTKELKEENALLQKVIQENTDMVRVVGKDTRTRGQRVEAAFRKAFNWTTAVINFLHTLEPLFGSLNRNVLELRDIPETPKPRYEERQDSSGSSSSEAGDAVGFPAPAADLSFTRANPLTARRDHTSVGALLGSSTRQAAQGIEAAAAAAASASMPTAIAAGGVLVPPLMLMASTLGEGSRSAAEMPLARGAAGSTDAVVGGGDGGDNPFA